jgi:hypothetical protein
MWRRTTINLSGRIYQRINGDKKELPKWLTCSVIMDITGGLNEIKNQLENKLKSPLKYSSYPLFIPPSLRGRFSPRRRIVPLRAGGQPVGLTGRRVEPSARRGRRPQFTIPNPLSPPRPIPFFSAIHNPKSQNERSPVSQRLHLNSKSS